MEPAAQLTALRGDANALAAVARDALDAPVPSCPGWTLEKLVAHLGGVYGWAVDVVADRPAEHSFRERPPVEAPSGPAVIDWFAGQTEGLVEALGAADPADEAWSWTADRTVGFWYRRQACETAVHRWDGEAAVRTPAAVDAELARDGIGELLELFVPLMRRISKAEPNGERYHVHCTDTDGEWLVQFDADATTVTAEHAKGDVALRGAASDLFLFLWHRVPADRIEVIGDTALADRWFELVPPI